ncbi:hypothetical protein [Bradyrhizobium sp. AZCC 1693]|uniref:hypothetical protein n=1 Tax=Bradyrhizobium sp. AZCC 1693 TaxID=3117029 RepID=UPI002FF1CF19
MDWLNWWIIAVVSLVTLYVAARLVLRHYSPPDTVISLNSPAMTLGSPLMSPAAARCHGQAIGASAWASLCRCQLEAAN